MMTKQIRLLTITYLAGWLTLSLSAAPVSAFAPGEIWRDTSGHPINAHGGGILYHEGVYYWYGELK
ncbi:MAG: glycosyl hydrolase family 43, partial [Verrucomicrobiae bacterium]